MSATHTVTFSGHEYELELGNPLHARFAHAVIEFDSCQTRTQRLLESAKRDIERALVALEGGDVAHRPLQGCESPIIEAATEAQAAAKMVRTLAKVAGIELLD